MSLPKLNRHVVTVLICVAVVVGVALAAGASYHAHSEKVAAEQAKTAQVQATQQRAHDNAVAKVQTAVNTECVKETKYFSLLTTAQKKGVEAPSCQTITVVR